MPRFVKIRRRLLRVVAPLSIVVAIAAYGAFLYDAHRSALRGQVTLHDTQQLGSSAHDLQNSKLDPVQGSVEIGKTVTQSASATWDLDPRTIDRPPDASLTAPRLFVAGLGLAFASRGGLVTLSIGGRTLDVLRPDVAGKLPPFGALNPPLVPVDIAPAYETLLLFDLPANDPCATTPCRFRIDTNGATWGVRRVGMILESTPQGRPLWNAPLNALAIVGIALTLAFLVHIVRSVTLLIARPIAAKR